MLISILGMYMHVKELNFLLNHTRIRVIYFDHIHKYINIYISILILLKINLTSCLLK